MEDEERPVQSITAASKTGRASESRVCENLSVGCQLAVCVCVCLSGVLSVCVPVSSVNRVKTRHIPTLSVLQRYNTD